MIELRIFRSCTSSAERRDAPRSLFSAFLFIRSKGRSRALLFGTGNTQRLGRENNLQSTIYGEHSTQTASFSASRTLTAGRPAHPDHTMKTHDMDAQQAYAMGTTGCVIAPTPVPGRGASLQKHPTNMHSDDNCSENILHTRQIAAPLVGGATQPPTSNLVDPTGERERLNQQPRAGTRP
jgi:hypothetical protein